jgi:hypothetical protein
MWQGNLPLKRAGDDNNLLTAIYEMTAEEFFMYLIIALVFIIPISVRIYRWFGMLRLKAQLKKDLS